MSGSRQQLDKISVSDIQLMSTVPFSQPLSAHISPLGRPFFTRGPNVVLVHGLANLVVMLADIAIAFHEGRQQRVASHLQYT